MIQKCLDAFCLSLLSLSGYLVTFSNLMALNLKKEGEEGRFDPVVLNGG